MAEYVCRASSVGPEVGTDDKNAPRDYAEESEQRSWPLSSVRNSCWKVMAEDAGEAQSEMGVRRVRCRDGDEWRDVGGQPRRTRRR